VANDVGVVDGVRLSSSVVVVVVAALYYDDCSPVILHRKSVVVVVVHSPGCCVHAGQLIGFGIVVVEDLDFVLEVAVVGDALLAIVDCLG